MSITDLLLGAASGVLVGSVIAAWLVTRQQRSRWSKLLARERARRASERTGDIVAMTAGLAHEIKNPLSTIGLNAQLLSEAVEDLDAPDDAKASLLRRLKTLEREVERLRGILTDFLDYAGGVHVETLVQDVNLVVDELIDFFLPQAEQAGVRLRATLYPGPLMAAVDAGHLKQALLNLLLNAVQAMRSAPGELLVRTMPAFDADGSRILRIHVTDTGPGMDGATLDRIFRPYFTTKSAGSGLGLPTARRLIEAHGGRIDVFSEVGKGTDITVVLPAETQAAGSP
ncbi:MAG: two-component sensor histidine kinase [Leptolyngbya sp. PLA3]|nr:MAG: two-component sensor histidine kinase [Cyanobacteria bacterium CYA]MCE7968229.1 two-component sensor histidine kinase [Leptolyngbya sp. PL-A3]